jgi:hypothetical protein
MGTTVFAAGTTKTIQAMFNAVTVKVDGKAIGGDNIKYGGNVYINTKNIASFLGKAYTTDKSGNVTIATKTESNTNSDLSKVIEFKMMYGTGDITNGTYETHITKIEKNIIGTPELKLVATNLSQKDISSFEFECAFLDSFGEKVPKLGTKDTKFKGVVQNANLKHKNSQIDELKDNNWNEYTFNLALYDLAYEVDLDSFKVTKVKYSDGSIIYGK